MQDFGRRARFRTWFPLREWRFESSLRHCNQGKWLRRIRATCLERLTSHMRNGSPSRIRWCRCSLSWSRWTSTSTSNSNFSHVSPVEGKYQTGHLPFFLANGIEIFKSSDGLVYKSGDRWLKLKRGIDARPVVKIQSLIQG